MDLSHNTVLVTGGGSGIGLALAKAFAQHGSTVLVCGRDEIKLQAVSSQISNIASFPCDIARDKNQQDLVEHVKRAYPDFNILINNAGIQNNYKFSETRDHTHLIEEEVDINLLAQLKLTDRLLPLLMARPCGAIVNVTSALAFVPKQSAPVYCATKAAMHIFTKSLRYQLEGSPVKVFEIIPALVDTAMTKGRGRGKISPEALAREALRGIESNTYEIRIGKTKILLALNRLLPSVAERILRSG
jgi:DHA1 family tetracycline resistance protein-like MFS transporter/uncharacterized oxidoreductase